MAIQFLNTGYFPDNAKLTFGDVTTPDLEIYHDGTDSYIAEVGTGDLIISGGNDIIFKDAVGNLLVNMNQSDRVELYFGGSKKFETYSTGAGVTGNLYFTSGSKIHFDNGVSNDYYIEKSGTTLTFNTGGTYVFNTGDVTFTDSLNMGSGKKIYLGGSTVRMQVYHTGSSGEAIVLNKEGNLSLVNQSHGDDILFKTENISGTVVTPLTLDSGGTATFAGNVTLGSSSKVSDEWMYIDSDANSSAGIQLLRGGASKWFIYNPGGGNNFKIYDNVGGGYMEIEPVGNVTFSSNILTNTDSSSDIGTTSKRWANLWVDSINGATPGTGSITGSGTATYLPIWTSGSVLGDSIISSASGDVTINGSDDNPVLYIEPSGSNIGDTAHVQFNSRASVGWDGYVTLSDNGQSKDLRLRVNVGNLYFQTDNTTRMTIEHTTGDVGIGITPTQKLHVDGHTLISAEKYYYVAGGGAGMGSDASGNLILRQNSADLMTTSGSDATFAGDVTIGSTNLVKLIDQSYGGQIQLLYGSDTWLQYHYTDNTLRFNYNGSGGDELTITTSGNATFAGGISADWLSLSNYATISGDLNLQADITVLNKAQSAYLNLAVRDTSGSETVYNLSNVGTITCGSVTSTGGQITGTLTFADGSELRLGASNDMGLFYSSGTSNIRVNSGILAIRADDMRLTNQANDEYYIKAVADGSVILYHNNIARLTTDGSGVTITSELASGTAKFSDNVYMSGGQLYIGALDSSTDDTYRIYQSSGQFILASRESGTWTTRFDIDTSGNATFTGTLTGTSATFEGTIKTLNTNDYGTIQFGSNASRYIRGNSAELQIGSTLNNLRFESTGANYIDSSTADGTTAFRINARTSHTSGNLFEVSNAGTTKLTVAYDGNTTFVGKAYGVTPGVADTDAMFATKGYVNTQITGATIYQGVWDPDVSLNSGYGNPDLSTVALQVNGYYYICSADGIAEPNGTGTEPDTWHTGDWVIWNDDVGVSGEWQKIDNTTVLSGAGTGEYLARWTDTETLGDSIVLTSGNDILIPQYIRHTSDPSDDTYFGFSANDTFTVYTAGGEGLNIDSNRKVTLTGVLSLPDGSVSAPSISNTGDLNTGIYWPGDHQLGFAVDGSRKFYMSATQAYFQNLSSGVSISAGGIDVTGDSTFAGTVSVTAADSITIADYILHSGDDSKFGFPSNDTFKIRTGGVDRFTLTNTDATFTGDVSVVGTGNATLILDSDSDNSGAAGSYLTFRDDGATKWVFYKETNNDLYVYNPGVGYPMHFLAGGDLKLLEDGNDLIVGTLSSGNTSTLTVNHEGGVPAIAAFKARTNRGHISIADNDTTGYITAEDSVLGFGFTSSQSASNLNILSSGNVGINTTSPDAKLEVVGGIIAGGKTTYTIVTASVTTTGTAVAGVSTGTNGQSSGFIFTCFGGDSGYQRIIYSCKNVSGTWDINKDIDEGANGFDVTYAADGSDNITFTFKSRSGVTQYYAPKVTVEAIGDQINQSYIN